MRGLFSLFTLVNAVFLAATVRSAVFNSDDGVARPRFAQIIKARARA